ncbi:SRPBCC domain-containing protein [Streptomyces liangshanensis]|uniref:Carbon monoxide dehydrogenase n=1 Tax=Streptomyces liangshanensis TaxID=2717324 RepID=A0A6G9GZS8_9ACTN|nr:SRPBCC domain-containing protein [Streptomyces liangshanensis]QIQ03576.1 carbon monoxide dehydrogenase [Streptomyces liangshanensis]
MEHEVFVPVTAETLRQTLRDPVRVARCVPGLQQDADAAAGALAGRLKFRAGGHTITYRGALTLAEGADGVFTVGAEGTEARGTGSAKLTLTLRLTDTAEGTTLAFTGGARAEGRLAELPPEAATAAAHRLLDRFATRLAEEAVAPETPEGPGAPGSGGKAARRDRPAPPPSADRAADALAPVEDAADAEDVENADDVEDPDADAGSGFGASVPPSALDGPPDGPLVPLDGETTAGEGDFLIPDEPPAEAAHARRTMIGRSAEEVDHAPPRGRYAPVPAPEAAGPGATLRWIAPAAALALASAVVVGRVLRRRK